MSEEHLIGAIVEGIQKKPVKEQGVDPVPALRKAISGARGGISNVVETLEMVRDSLQRLGKALDWSGEAADRLSRAHGYMDTVIKELVDIRDSRSKISLTGISQELSRIPASK